VDGGVVVVPVLVHGFPVASSVVGGVRAVVSVSAVGLRRLLQVGVAGHLPDLLLGLGLGLVPAGLDLPCVVADSILGCAVGTHGGILHRRPRRIQVTAVHPPVVPGRAPTAQDRDDRDNARSPGAAFESWDAPLPGRRACVLSEPRVAPARVGLHGPIPEVAMSTDGTPATDGADGKADAPGDEVQRKSQEKSREMSDRPEQRPEKNTDGDPESDPS